MSKRPIGKEEQTKKGGLTLEELEAQVGGLLPSRIEMRRHHHHHGGGIFFFAGSTSGTAGATCGNGIINVAGCGLDLL